MIGPARRFLDFIFREWLPGYFRESKRWVKVPHHTNPRVFYGYDEIIGKDGMMSGGLVKVTDLLLSFPNSPKNANVLYMVSSALPAFKPGFARLFLPHLSILMFHFAKRSGAKIVLNQNGVAYPAWYGKGWQRANKVNSYLLRNADYVVYQSKFCKESADKFASPCGADWDILYNPVDTSFFTTGALRPDNEVVIGVMGSHWQEYRIQNTIETIGTLRSRGCNARLQIGGRLCWLDSHEAGVTQIKEWSHKYNVVDSVTYLGPYEQEEAVSIYQQCDLLIHSKYNDPCPRVVVEAMACGLPIVYSDSGGVPELVGEKAGIGVDTPVDWLQAHPPSAILLANAVEQAIANKKNMSFEARQRAEKYFDVHEWIAAHSNIFNELLKS